VLRKTKKRFCLNIKTRNWELEICKKERDMFCKSKIQNRKSKKGYDYGPRWEE